MGATFALKVFYTCITCNTCVRYMSETCVLQVLFTYITAV